MVSKLHPFKSLLLCLAIPSLCSAALTTATAISSSASNSSGATVSSANQMGSQTPQMPPASSTALGSSAISTAMGGNSSGGGYACFPNSGSPVLVDLINANPSFRDASTQPPLVLGKVGEVLGYEIHAAKDLPAYSLAVQRIGAWEQSSPILIGVLKEALANLQWRFSPFSVATPQETYVASDEAQKQCTSISPVVYYTNFLGALTNVKVWNAFGQESQAALLIHEALRRVQLRYGENQTTDQLQKITATLMFQSPGAIATLDSQDFVSGSLLSTVEVNAGYFARRTAAFAEVCAFQQLSFCSQTSLPRSGDEGYNFDNTMYHSVQSLIESTSDVPTLEKAMALQEKLNALLTDQNEQALAMNTLQFMDVGDQIEQTGLALGVGEDVIFNYILTGKTDSVKSSLIKKTIKQIHDSLEQAASQ